MSESQIRSDAHTPLTDDPAGAMARLRDFTRRILAVPKSEIPKHLPQPRKALPKRKRK